jgi:hypothetical protein
MTEVSDYQKVAALLSMDVQIYAKVVANDPSMAVEVMADLEKRRLRLIEDADWRDMRYAAAGTIFNVVAHGADLDESGE